MDKRDSRTASVHSACMPLGSALVIPLISPVLECPCEGGSEKYRVIVNYELHRACPSCLMLIGLSDEQIALVVTGERSES